MVKKISVLLTCFLWFNSIFSQSNDSAIVKPLRPKTGSFSSYLVMTGLVQNFNIGMENSNYYTLSGFNSQLPVFNLKYLYSYKHHFGVKIGSSLATNSYTKTDSLKFRSTIFPSKSGHYIPLNPSYPGYMEDNVTSSTRNIIFMPFYEYHFKGNRRWDYYVGAEYILRFQLTKKSKNLETIKITNTNKDVIEYTNQNTKGGAITTQGGVADAGVNYFIYKWLSVGTKISFSFQTVSPNPTDFEEKLMINGVDMTSLLLTSGNSKTTTHKTNYNGFLGSGFGGVMINFYL